MRKFRKWMAISLGIVLTLAGCVSFTTPAGSVPTVTPASTLAPTPAPTQTATLAPTPAIEPTVPIDPDSAVVLTWEREGGIAGFCDILTLYASGRVLLTSCRGEPQELYLSDAEMEQVSAWMKALSPLEHVQSDGAVADSMTVRLTFAGQGAQAATGSDVQAMLDFAAALLPAPASPPLQTSVRYVLANEDVTMYAGPGPAYPQIGQVFGGQVAWVTGVSADGAWWRVICPDDTVGSCWLPARHELTQPTTPQGAWSVFMFSGGMSVDYPAGWFYEPNAYDETQQSVWFHPLEMGGPSVGVEMYRRPVQEQEVADPFAWQQNEGGYRVHWSRPITTVQGVVGIEFVWGAYLESEKAWDVPPQLMVIYYNPQYELDVRLTTPFDGPALELLGTAGFTETVTAQFGLFHRMAQSIRLHSTSDWETYHDAQTGGIFDIAHPQGWAVGNKEVECGILYGLDSLQLVVFDACRAEAAEGGQLTFFETYQRFRAAFSDERAVTQRDVNGLRVEVVQYGTAGDNGIVALDAGPGTVAVWQIGERGFALIDPGNQHLQDGAYEGVLGSFLILGTTWAQPQPVEGTYAPDRHMAFDLPGLPVTILLPAGYGMTRNTEYLRRGSLVSFDFTPYGELPRLYEIQFFSKSSIQAFSDRCNGGLCFEGDYPDVERYRAQEAAMARCADLPPYEARRFGDRCYLLYNHRCTGDACVIREYTTFLDDLKVDVWIMMQDTSQVDASDVLFAAFEIVEQE